MNMTLSIDTQDEIIRALGDKINRHRRWIIQYKLHELQDGGNEEERLTQAIAAYNEVAEQLNIKPITE